MSIRNFLKTGIILIAVLTFGAKLTAADVIRLTWSQNQSSGYKCLTVKATSGKTYTINWGDGSAAETKTGTGNSQYFSHAYTGTSNRNVVVTAGSGCRFTSFICSDDCNSSSTESNNRVSSLTFTDCSALEYIDCSHNLLTSLTLTNLSSLGNLSCDDNKLTSLTLTGCSALESLDCYNNQLTSLDLSGCPNLVFLSCRDNKMTTITNCSHIPSLDCSNNLFTTFTGWSNLSDLTCSNNKLTNLDLSACHSLSQLRCDNNLLTNLDLSATPFLWTLHCYKNKLQLSNLFEVHSKVSDRDSKWLGTQNLEPQTVSTQQALFFDQSVFNSIYTSYTIIKDDSPAPETDYTVNQGKLIFNDVGTYTVTMTNSEIISYSSYPARAIIVLTVEEGEPVVDAQTPVITAQPQSATYSQNATATALSVTATITDGGELSYQWYSNTSNSTTGGIAVGTDSDTYIPPTTTIGTMYYYVVVTNTNNSATNTTTATTTSNTAMVTINTGTTDIADIENDATLKLYPNPVSGQLYIVIPNGASELSEQIQIYDFSGKLVLQKVVTRPQAEVDISHLPDGMYVVKTGTVSAKIVKQ
ncbi:MAG: T9SS type A sorting domain-containing protein [Bacteroidales bacterium]|jgi:hypothetical protein|nr:T9SS type A sorting domain-containing protein [Bacteroidales bacterium]